MIPDPKWLDALKLPLKVTIAVALSSIALLTLDLTALLDLGPLGGFTTPVLIIVSLVFSILAVVEIIDQLLIPFREKRRQSALAARRAVRRKEKEEQLTAKREQIIARLDHLSKEEVRYAADALRKGSPSFYTYIHSPPVSMLLGKGLVWTPGGQHHQDYYPFCFHDFVWEKLIERRESMGALRRLRSRPSDGGAAIDPAKERSGGPRPAMHAECTARKVCECARWRFIGEEQKSAIALYARQYYSGCRSTTCPSLVRAVSKVAPCT